MRLPPGEDDDSRDDGGDGKEGEAPVDGEQDEDAGEGYDGADENEHGQEEDAVDGTGEEEELAPEAGRPMWFVHRSHHPQFILLQGGKGLQEATFQRHKGQEIADVKKSVEQRWGRHHRRSFT